MISVAKPATRVIRTHEEWQPHGYQERGVLHLIERRSAALFLDPGLGKTAIVLEAFRELKAQGMVRRMLVVAPLRVCQLVWEQEGRKWTQFRDLTFSLLHGPKKEERLWEQTDIHLINPEGIAWFTRQFYGRTDLPYDIVTVDELPKFKNAHAVRSKKLRKKLGQVKYRWGLTGSPAPNGYMDLFGQMLILDDGAALGRYITYFRDQYFTRNFDGFSYDLKPDGGERIEAKIAPYVLRMSADDYLDLPPLRDNLIEIELSKEARRQYSEMKKEMIISLPEGVVTAANSAAVYTKLAQLANGAVYLSEDTYAEVHTAKLDALEDLIEELAGQQLLLAYEFQHDLARLQERFPGVPTLTGKSHKQIVEIEAAWNNGRLPVLFAHPASAGHGLNLQGSGASHVCWFSRPWDLDLYDQFIRRLLRQGTTATHIMNHTLVVKDSIDEIKGEALRDKDVTQRRLLKALNAEVIKDTPIRRARQTIIIEEETMTLKKLGFQSGGAAAPADAAPQPRGWGKPQNEETSPERAEETPVRPRGWGAPGGTAPDEQRQQINEKLRAPEPDEDEDEAPPPATRALEAFGVVQQLTGGIVRTGGPLYGASTEGSKTRLDDPRKPETTEKSPARSRKTAKPAPVPAEIRPENTAAQGAANASVAGMEFETLGYFGGIKVELTGLPPAAVAAALTAIAASLGERE